MSSPAVTVSSCRHAASRPDGLTVRPASATTMLVTALVMVSLAALGARWLLPLSAVTPGASIEGLLHLALLLGLTAPLMWFGVVQPFIAQGAALATGVANVLTRAPDGIVTVDEAGRITFVNERLLIQFGYSADELLGQPIEMLVPEAVRQAHRGHRQQYGRAPDQRAMGREQWLMGRRRDGTEFPVDIALSHVTDGRRTSALAFVRDVSEQRATWAALTEAKLRIEAELHDRQGFRAMTELLQSVQDPSDIALVLKPCLQNLLPGTVGSVFQYSASRDLLSPLARWGANTPADPPFRPEACWSLRLGKPYGTLASENAASCTHDEGADAPYLCVPLLADGQSLGLLHLRLASSQDAADPARHHQMAALQSKVVNIAERLGLALANCQLRETLKNQSVRDGLTGLFNRRYLDTALEREVVRATRHQRPVSVVMLDLDHFKRLNDTFGHRVGDDLLSAFGRFLTANLRAEDTICRYGGEEFVILLPEAPARQALDRLDCLRREFATVTVATHAGGRASATYSAGIATCPQDGITWDALLKAADLALYRAKAEGRNRVVAAGPSVGDADVASHPCSA